MYFKEQVMDINRNNYESFFLLYLDRELSQADRQSVEKFLQEHSDLQKEFGLLQQTIFSPSPFVYEGKESLLRKEEKRRVIPIYWMGRAAAVAILILGSWLLISRIVRNATDKMIPAEKGIASNAAANKSLVPVPEIEQKDQPVKSTDQSYINPGTKINTPVKSSGLQAYTSPGTKKINSQAKLPDQAYVQSGTKQINTPAVKNMTTQEVGNPGTIQDMNIAENGAAIQKSSAALELQSADLPTSPEIKQMTVMTAADLPSLRIASDEKDQNNKEKGNLKASDFQNENAISVIALNDKNKAITGFFKKLTSRAPADDSERKVRVSVFQFSY